jgi:hypothetical protein
MLYVDVIDEKGSIRRIDKRKIVYVICVKTICFMVQKWKYMSHKIHTLAGGGVPCTDAFNFQQLIYGFIVIITRAKGHDQFQSVVPP